jgi:hypothetical protein
MAGQLYFAAEAWVLDRPGLDLFTRDFDLVRGIPVHGQVTEQSTQRAPRAAVVEYYPLFPNAYSAKITAGMAAASSAVIQSDGSYRLVVLPGPGVICVAASPRDSYAVAILDRNELLSLFNDTSSFSNSSLRVSGN